MLSQRAFSLIAGIILSLVAVGHLLRLIYSAPVEIAGHIVPLWVSWPGLLVAGYLGICGLVLSQRKILGVL